MMHLQQYALLGFAAGATLFVTSEAKPTCKHRHPTTLASEAAYPSSTAVSPTWSIASPSSPIISTATPSLSTIGSTRTLTPTPDSASLSSTPISSSLSSSLSPSPTSTPLDGISTTPSSLPDTPTPNGSTPVSSASSAGISPSTSIQATPSSTPTGPPPLSTFSIITGNSPNPQANNMPVLVLPGTPQSYIFFTNPPYASFRSVRFTLEPSTNRLKVDGIELFLYAGGSGINPTDIQAASATVIQQTVNGEFIRCSPAYQGEVLQCATEVSGKSTFAAHGSVFPNLSIGTLPFSDSADRLDLIVGA